MNCIYKITNTLNNKIYIGKTTNIKRRIKEYKYKSKKLNSHTNYLIMQVIHNYGFENFKFEIVEDNIPLELLDDREIYWIKHFNAKDPNIGYNSKDGGVGGSMNTISKIKMSESSKSFRHTEEEKLRRSKPIIVYYDNGIIRCFSSAKQYAEYLGRSRSEVTAAIKRGIKINNSYVFYQELEPRTKVLDKLTIKKMRQKDISKRSFYAYLIAYSEVFRDNKSVETNY